MAEIKASLAVKEKKVAALSSVIAAIVLTSFKIIVGAATGSLGILAEAAHSGLDLVAALVTYLAVRISDKPADTEHTYGHGKVENLSALFETLLLLITCVWIIYEAVNRLFFKEVLVEANIWSFIVMLTSIVIDYSRSRILYRAAVKYRSQALEADAIHFSTDIWSSSVVIIGLVGVKLAGMIPGVKFLEKTDSVAALGVAVIVVLVSIKLGMRTIRGLLDTAPEGMVEKVSREVKSLPGVLDCHNVRIRYSGPTLFVDAHVVVNGGLTLEEAHSMTEVMEAAISRIVPGADVTVHPEPALVRGDAGSTTRAIIKAVEALPGVVNCHDVHVRYSGPTLFVDVHVLIDGKQDLWTVHHLMDIIEKTILGIIPYATISVHPEPVEIKHSVNG
jgi:cation diffusion facilitator family transporter